MRVKSVTYEATNPSFNPRYVIRFEHNGVEWEKFLDSYRLDDLSFRSFLNSVIEDTIVRCR